MPNLSYANTKELNMSDNNGNGNKVWSAIFEGLRLNWVWVIGFIGLIVMFSNDRAVIIQSVKNSETTLVEINAKLKEFNNQLKSFEERIVNLQLTNNEKLGFLRTEDALIKQRLQRIEENYANQ